MAIYSKLIVDGICVKVWKGSPTQDVLRTIGLAGIHIELANAGEYDALHKRPKPTAKKTQLRLF